MPEVRKGPLKQCPNLCLQSTWVGQHSFITRWHWITAHILKILVLRNRKITVEPACQNKWSRKCKAVASVSPPKHCRDLWYSEKSSWRPLQAPSSPSCSWKQDLPCLTWPPVAHTAAQSKNYISQASSQLGFPCEPYVQYPGVPREGIRLSSSSPFQPECRMWVYKSGRGEFRMCCEYRSGRGG